MSQGGGGGGRGGGGEKGLKRDFIYVEKGKGEKK